jgi:hypothetical protein
VNAWRQRFELEGLKAFAGVRPGRGRKQSISPEKVAEIVHATLHEKPVGETHWSCRSMVKAHGVSPATVQRIWSGRGLKPTFQSFARLFPEAPSSAESATTATARPGTSASGQF